MRSSRKIKSELNDQEVVNSSLNEPVAEQESATDSTPSTVNDVTNMLDTIDKKSEVSDELQALLALKPILENFDKLLVKDENNIINNRLGLEEDTLESRRVKSDLVNTVNSIAAKVKTINDHIDGLLNSAPTKLTVTVSASDKDMNAIQQMYNGKIAELKKAHEDQLDAINQNYQQWSKEYYDRANRQQHEIHKKLQQEEGIYLTGFWCWVCGFFFWAGVIIVVGFFAVQAYKSFV